MKLQLKWSKTASQNKGLKDKWYLMKVKIIADYSKMGLKETNGS